MKIIESNILHNETMGELLYVKYEDNGIINTLPLYVIKDNKLTPID